MDVIRAFLAGQRFYSGMPHGDKDFGPGTGPGERLRTNRKATKSKVTGRDSAKAGERVMNMLHC
jgi:hypothetical protein